MFQACSKSRYSTCPERLCVQGCGCSICSAVLMPIDHCLCCAGAPAIASTAGAFVAGNFSAPVEGHIPLANGNPHPPSFESAWREEADTLHDLDVVPHSQPAIYVQDDKPGEPSASAAFQETLPEHRPSGGKGKGGVAPKGGEDADDIALGFSPGSVPTSSEAKSSKSSESKFDKYYYKNLASIKFKKLLG